MLEGLVLLTKQHVRLWHYFASDNTASGCTLCSYGRFELVYACGDRQPLSARQERVSAMQALLHVLTLLADSGASSCPELHQEGVAVWTPAADEVGTGWGCTHQG